MLLSLLAARTEPPQSSWPGFVPAIHVVDCDEEERRGCP
jgi:hypothetical protein